MENYKESMVIYESSYLAINYLPDEKMKWEAIEGLMKYGFYGEVPESDNPLINMVYVQAIPSMRNAKQRYEKAVDDGKKGGRPATIDRDTVYKLKEQGMTHQQIADQLGCSKEAIKKIFQREGTKGTNLSVSVSDSVSVSVSDSVSDSVSTAVASEKEKKEEDFKTEEEENISYKEDTFINLLKGLNCTQLQQIKDMYANGTPYKEIASTYNIKYFDAAKFAEHYDEIYKERYDMEHPEEVERRQQQEQAIREQKRAEREEDAAMSDALQHMWKNKNKPAQYNNKPAQSTAKQMTMIDGSAIDSRLAGQSFPESILGNIKNGIITVDELVEMQFDSMNAADSTVFW